MEYQLESVPCCYSTTEGDPELYPSKGNTAVCTHTLGQSKHSAPLHYSNETSVYFGWNRRFHSLDSLYPHSHRFYIHLLPFYKNGIAYILHLFLKQLAHPGRNIQSIP